MKNPKTILALSFLFVVTLLLNSSCKKDDDTGNFCDGLEQPERRLKPTDYWILKHSLGDTLRFKMYRKDKTNGNRYNYLREVTFVASDTSTVTKHFDYWGVDAECFDNFPMYCHRLRFSGPYKLDCDIEPTPLGPYLRLFFSGINYGFSTDLLRNRGRFWHEALKVGDSTYYGVTHNTGFPEGKSYQSYVDSTYAYYSQNEGILKFIVNDTLMFERYY